MREQRFFPLLLVIAAALILTSASSLPPAPASPEVQAALSSAYQARLQSAPRAQSPLSGIFTPELDTAFTTPDGKTAVLWLALRDGSGRRLATEPGLALAVASGAGWQVLLPGDPAWQETWAALPVDMLPMEQRPAPSPASGVTVQAAPLTGYFLPYVAGTSHFLEGSISHFQSIPELGYPSCSAEFCRYAYDFTDFGHFPLVASKDGQVVDSRDTCTDGNTGCTNYIVLFNQNDQAYQIYLHLAHGTIPDSLAPDTPVLRGQYLGDTDDTGYSTSQHVHFMVVPSIWVGGDGYYWGRSMDIRFSDVSINNGIPRNCYEVTQFQIYDGATECLGNKADPRNPANDWFVSGNQGAYPPGGSISRPASGATVMAGSNPLMDVTANGIDDVGVVAARLAARINGQWVEIGPRVTQPLSPGVFDWDVNLCAVAPLNGPLDVAVRFWDYEGNASGLLDPRTILVDYACPPPASQLKPALTFNSTAVRLEWDAAAAGAGINTFELQWRPEPGAWSPGNTLVLAGDRRSTWFNGQPGGAYAFRLRALDANGQPEPWPANDAAETVAVLPAQCTPDAFEPDDTPAQAFGLALGQAAERNLCGPGDPDWFKLTLPTTREVLISAYSVNGGAAAALSVYAADGSTLLAGATAPGIGQDVHLVFRPTSAGSVYVQVGALQPNLSGSDAIYRLAAAEAKQVYLPVVLR